MHADLPLVTEPNGEGALPLSKQEILCNSCPSGLDLRNQSKFSQRPISHARPLMGLPQPHPSSTRRFACLHAFGRQYTRNRIVAEHTSQELEARGGGSRFTQSEPDHRIPTARELRKGLDRGLLRGRALALPTPRWAEYRSRRPNQTRS